MKRNYAITTLFLNCGMRLSELVGIDLKDIAWDECQLNVIGKGNKERTIYVNKLAEYYINEYLSKNYKNKNNKNNLFITADESSLRKSLILSATKSNLSYAKEISPHWLRVFWATNALEKGIDLATIRDALGHSNISITSGILSE